MKLNINRHIVIVVVCALVLFAGGIYANKAWNTHVVQDARVSFQARLVKAQADYKARKDAEHNAQVEAAFKSECQKEVDYYNNLPAAQKKLKTAPACQDLEFIQ